ncbi:MAG: cation:proton antiporter [Candidatus Cloacimonetes bacterium]|nr:cation:proton antiporter [Candidatus Cloacimonadota bacterium]
MQAFYELIHREAPLVRGSSELFVLAVLVLTGLLFTRLARRVHLPAVTGQILGGILIGQYVLHIFDEQILLNFRPITNFVLGFIGLIIGSHLDFRKLHNAGRRIIWITVIDILLVAPLVFVTMRYMLRLDLYISLLVAVIAGATAPGSVLHVVKDRQARGMFTKTVLAVVALNNVLIILLFYTMLNIIQSHAAGELRWWMFALGPLRYLGESLLDGGLLGLGLILLTEKFKKLHFSFPAMVLLSVVLAVGISESLHFSGLLSCLILGMIITNFSHYREEFFSAFHDLEEIIFSLFFVLAGTHFDFTAMKVAGVAGLALIAARSVGKFAGPSLGAVFARSTKTTRRLIGISLFPMAGVAIGLVLVAGSSEMFAGHASLLTAIVLTAVVVFELMGPVLTGVAIKRSGEAHKNRLRLLDFLQEEYIKIGLDAEDKWEVLDEMAEFLYMTHNIKELSLEELKISVREREHEITTGVGQNLAIPHAIIDGGPMIRGVIGICANGIEFESFDGKPVKIIILIATPRDHYEMHLQVLANVAKIFGHHSIIKEKIINARLPEEVYELLQNEEVDKLNPFFDGG